MEHSQMGKQMDLESLVHYKMDFQKTQLSLIIALYSLMALAYPHMPCV
jgi:hypothetical protein